MCEEWEAYKGELRKFYYIEMEVNVVKKLVENHTLEELKQAEQALIQDQPLAFEVFGIDLGEKLNYLIAAVQTLEKMNRSSIEFDIALNDYTKHVKETFC